MLDLELLQEEGSDLSANALILPVVQQRILCLVAKKRSHEAEEKTCKVRENKNRKNILESYSKLAHFLRVCFLVSVSVSLSIFIILVFVDRRTTGTLVMWKIS